MARLSWCFPFVVILREEKGLFGIVFVSYFLLKKIKSRKLNKYVVLLFLFLFLLFLNESNKVIFTIFKKLWLLFPPFFKNNFNYFLKNGNKIFLLYYF